MSYPVLTITLGILGSLVFRDVSALTLPLPDNNIITSRMFAESNQDIPRSLEMEDFTFSVVPTSGRVNSPTVLRLQPVLAKPSHLHANLPLRFGRDDYVERTPKSSINLPQRFGRAQASDSSFSQLCTECRRAETPPSATLPQRFGRRNAFVADPFRALAVLTRTLESFPRTQDYDYILEDKALNSKKYIE